jgi:acetyl-CoA acyltransferase
VKFGVSREAQDEFSLLSHQRAVRAVESGVFDSQIVPLNVKIVEPKNNGDIKEHSFSFSRDEGPRGDTTLQALAKLKPAFKEGGTVTGTFPDVRWCCGSHHHVKS